MKSKSRHLIVVEPGRIELQELDVDAALEPHQALVEAEYSIVSAGTEGAGFTGLVRETACSPSPGTRRWSRRTPHEWRCPYRTTLRAVIWCSLAWPG